MKVRITVIFLMLSFILCACSDKVSDKNISHATNTAEATDTEPDDGVDKHDIEKSDYEGRDFTFVTWDDFSTNKYFFCEESSGDILETACFDRNLAVEEYLNIKLVNIGIPNPGTEARWASFIQSDIMSGDGAYDIVLNSWYLGIFEMVTGNMLFDWNDVPYIDLSKNYWNQTLNETLAIQGVLFVAAGDYIPANSRCLVYNKQLQIDYNLPNFNEVVFSGNWTLDKFIEYSNAVTSDVDGDGKFTVADYYGFSLYCDYNLQEFFVAADMDTVYINEDGDLTITPLNEKIVNLISKLRDFFAKDSVYTYHWRDAAELQMDFADGHTLFSDTSTDELEQLRTMEVDFGVLPIPKYDENQKNYVSLAGSYYLLVPRSVKDIELVGKTAELLNHYSRKIYRPAYFDVALTGKYIRDNESEAVLEILFDTARYDAGFIYGAYNPFSYNMMQFLYSDSKAEVASYYRANIDRIQKSIYDKINEAVRAYKEES